MKIRFSNNQKFPIVPTLMGILLYFSGILISATPLPYVYIYFRKGRKDFIAAAILSLIAIALLYGFGTQAFHDLNENFPKTGWFVSVPVLHFLRFFPALWVAVLGVGYFVFYLAMATIVASVLSAPQNIYQKSLRSILALFLVISVFLAVFIIPQSEKFLIEYRSGIQELIQTLSANIDKASEVDSVSAIYIKSLLVKWGENLFYFLPVLFLSSISFIFVLNLVVAKRIFFPFKPELLLINLTSFRLPFYFVWFFASVLGLLLANVQFFNLDILTFVCLNVIFGLFILYFYLGLSVFIFILDIYNIRGLFRIIIYFFFIYMFFMSLPFFALIGFFDSWLDIRKRLIKRKMNQS